MEEKEIANVLFDKADGARILKNLDYAQALYFDGLLHSPDDVERGHRPLFEMARYKSGKKKKKSKLFDFMNKKPKIIEDVIELEKIVLSNPYDLVSIIGLSKFSNVFGLNALSLYLIDELIDEDEDELTEQMLADIAEILENLGMYSDAIRALNSASSLEGAKSKKYSIHIEKLIRRIATQDKPKEIDISKQEVLTTIEQRLEEINEKLRLLIEDPNNVDLLVSVGDLYAKIDDLDSAKQYYRRARVVDGSDYKIKFKIDDVRIREFRKEIKNAEEEAANHPHDDVLKQKYKDLDERRSQFELEIFKERSEQYPADADMNFELANRYYKVGKIAEAISQFQIAVADEQKKVSSLNMLGKCFFSNKLYKEASVQFENAIEAHNSDSDNLWKEIQYNLCASYEHMGAKEKAAEGYSKIIMIDFNYRDASERLLKIRETIEKKEDGTEKQ